MSEIFSPPIQRGPTSRDYKANDIFKTAELIPSAQQFPSPFKSLPQKGSSCRKDLPYPSIVPAVNDRFREREKNCTKNKIK